MAITRTSSSLNTVPKPQNRVKIVLTSLSKAKKSRSPRAQFYSALMTNLGGSTGDALGEAFTANEHDKFQTLMLDLSNKMANIKS